MTKLWLVINRFSFWELFFTPSLQTCSLMVGKISNQRVFSTRAQLIWNTFMLQVPKHLLKENLHPDFVTFGRKKKQFFSEAILCWTETDSWNEYFPRQIVLFSILQTYKGRSNSSYHFQEKMSFSVYVAIEKVQIYQNEFQKGKRLSKVLLWKNGAFLIITFLDYLSLLKNWKVGKRPLRSKKLLNFWNFTEWSSALWDFSLF